MSQLQQKPVKLSEDVLYIIAEKLLAKVPDGQRIDFRQQNPYRFFMGHNKMAMRVIISQFAKFKRIDFTTQGIQIDEEEIHFYKNADKSARINDSQTGDFSFGGPYIVPWGMLEYIIERGKFRVNTIETCLFLLGHSTDIKELGEMNSLKAFCTLFLGKQIQIPDGLNNNIEVKKFKIDESVVSIQNNLETILAIDAVELEIDNTYTGDHNLMIDCSQYKSSIIAKNTTKIIFNSYFNFFKSSKENHKKFATNFETFCSFLIRACPALNNLHIPIHVCPILSTLSIGPFTENLRSTIKSMETYIKSIKIGNENLHISIELVARLDEHVFENLPNQSHELFQLGSPLFTVEDAGAVDSYARSLECVDALGRIHKLLFKIVQTDGILHFHGCDEEDDGYLILFNDQSDGDE